MSVTNTSSRVAVRVVSPASFTPAARTKSSSAGSARCGSPAVSVTRSPASRTEFTVGSAARSAGAGRAALSGAMSRSMTCSPPTRAMSSAGVPSAIARPWSITATRSHRRSASSM